MLRHIAQSTRAPRSRPALDTLCNAFHQIAKLALRHGRFGETAETLDLEDEIGPQSIVSEILNGKRALNVGHIKRLAERFKVSPSLFIG